MVTTAIILCGGMGKWAPSQKQHQSPSTSRNAVDLVLHKLSSSYGIKKFVLGFQGNKIRKYVESAFASKDLNFDFIDTGADAPIHARISAVMPSSKGEENVVLLNSDTIFDFDLRNV